MNNTPDSSSDLVALLDAVRGHLVKAQELMDSINPNSVFGARVQHLLDELEAQAVRDLSLGSNIHSAD